MKLNPDYVSLVTSRVIYLSILGLMAVGIASFFLSPQYEKGVWVATEALTSTLSASLGAKFGLAIPGIVGRDTPPKDEQP